MSRLCRSDVGSLAGFRLLRVQRIADRYQDTIDALYERCQVRQYGDAEAVRLANQLRRAALRFDEQEAERLLQVIGTYN